MVKTYDEALVALRVRVEQRQVRQEVSRAEAHANQPTVFLPAPQRQDVRPVPNSILRSSLFAALGKIKPSKRKNYYRQTLASLNGIEVRFTGQQLDQGDLDLWLTLLHLGQKTPLGTVAVLSSYKLLNTLGLTDSGATREDLEAALVRLTASAVELAQGKGLFIGSLVDSAARSDDGACWIVRLSPDLAKILGPSDWTGLDWTARRSLRGRPLAQWLHGYYSSHIQAHPISVARLSELSGSTAELRSFITTLKRALTAVQAVSRTPGREFHWSIRSGLVTVVNTIVRNGCEL